MFGVGEDEVVKAQAMVLYQLKLIVVCRLTRWNRLNTHTTSTMEGKGKTMGKGRLAWGWLSEGGDVSGGRAPTWD